MLLFKFWSVFLFYSLISITGVVLIWEPNLIQMAKKSIDINWYFIVFIFLFSILDSIFERITINPEEREAINKKSNLPLTKRQIIILFSGLAIFIILTPFWMNYFTELYQWLTENIDQNIRNLMIVFLIVLWWLIKIKKLWNNYHAIKSDHATVS